MKKQSDRAILYQQIYDVIYSYPTKNVHGFVSSEINNVKSKFQNLNEEKFNEALMGITCMSSSTGEAIIYHCDVEHALRCAIEGRSLNVIEFD